MTNIEKIIELAKEELENNPYRPTTSALPGLNNIHNALVTILHYARVADGCQKYQAGDE